MFAKLFVGGIITACCLLVIMTFSVAPGYRSEFVHSPAVEVYINFAFLGFVVIAAFGSLLKWS